MRDATFFYAICIGWGAIGAVWGALLVAQHAARRRGLMLRPLPPHASLGVDWPSVAVIIAARDEADSIGTCLRHVLEQDYPCLQVILVDDRSSDATGAIARHLARDDWRLRVHRIDELPGGWLAKSHALWRGARETSGADWLLFIDADCTMHPAAVRTAVAEAWRYRVDALTLWPRNGAVTFWEHMLIPLCAGIIALWFGTAQLDRSPRRAAFANGQFLLMRRTTYMRIGGHAVVRRAIIEDIPLAERARDHGVTVRVASGRDLIAVRMYRNLREIVDGWSRIYVGALRSGWKIALSIAWLLVGSLLPHVAAALLAANAVRGAAIDARTLVLALLCAQHLALLYLVSIRFWAMGRCRRAHLWLYPLSVVVVIAILARALWLLAVRREIRWRHTSYAIGAHGTILG